MLDWLARPICAIAILGVSGALLFLINLGSYPIYTKGEAREAVTVFDIVNGGGVILPMRAGVEIPSKPLLMHWLAAVISLIAGSVSEWTVRAPSALCAIGGMIACYLYVRRLFDPRCGFIAALILGTSIQYLQAGGGARVDMTLAFLLEVALFEFLMIAEGLTLRTVPLYLAIALAVLTKGPIGAVLPVLVTVVWIALYREWGLIARLRLRRGALLVGLIGGGWYLAAIVVGGGAFVHKQIIVENLYRIMPQAAVNVGHSHGFYYEDVALLGGFMPWTIMAAIAGAQFFSGPRRIDRRLGYLLVWFLTVLVFYNFPHSKRGVYLLALYPALSTIVAILLVDRITAPDGGGDRNYAMAITGLSRAAGLFFGFCGLAAASGLILILAAPAALLWLLNHWWPVAADLVDRLRSIVGSRTLAAALIPTAAVLIGAALLRTGASLEKLIFGIAAGWACLAMAVSFVIEPTIANTLTLKDFANEVRTTAGPDPVGYFGNLDYDFAFYNGRDLRLTSPLDPKAPAWIVSPEDDWRLVAARLSSNYVVVLRSNPTALDGSGRMLLLRYRPIAAPGTGKSLSL